MLKIKKVLLVLSLIASLFFSLAAPAALADPYGCTTDTVYDSTTQQCVTPDVAAANAACAPYTNNKNNDKAACKSCVKTFGATLTLPENKDQLSSCIACNHPGLSYDENTQSCLSENGIVKDLNLIINLLAGLASIIIIGVIITGGIQYAMSGTPQAAAEAKKKISNALIALFGFIFIWAFLQWLLPGGL